MNGGLETRDSLLLRVRQADDLAWREFFEIYTPIVLSYAARRGLQASDAEEIAQEVMIEVARCIRNFEYQPEKGRFRDWLGLVARRRIQAFWRKANTGVSGLQSDLKSNDLDPEWIDEFQERILQIAMEKIRPRFADVTWQLFVANWIERLPALEVAARYQVPIEVVYNAKSRVLQALEAEVVRISDDCAWVAN